MATQDNPVREGKILILATETCAYPGADSVGQAKMLGAITTDLKADWEKGALHLVEDTPGEDDDDGRQVQVQEPVQEHVQAQTQATQMQTKEGTETTAGRTHGGEGAPDRRTSGAGMQLARPSPLVLATARG